MAACRGSRQRGPARRAGPPARRVRRPTSPESSNQKLYQFASTGVWLDYLTYGGWFEDPNLDLQESCFCEACIAAYCESEGVDAESPRVILEKHGQLWGEHMCRRVAGQALRFARVIRESRPETLIGAYMCSYLPHEYDGALSRIFAQDYSLFEAAIDVFTPLIYANKSGREPDRGRRSLEVSPGLFLEHIAAFTVPAWGLQMFSGREVVARADGVRLFADAVARVRGTIERR